MAEVVAAVRLISVVDETIGNISVWEVVGLVGVFEVAEVVGIVEVAVVVGAFLDVKVVEKV